MALALVNGRVMTDRGLAEGVAVLIEGERIAALAPREELTGPLEVRDLRGALLLPGFIDTQVNGGAGLLFNDEPTAATIAAIGASPGLHWCSVPPETKIAASPVTEAITAPRAARACRS